MTTKKKAAAKKGAMISIDGNEYDISKLSDTARQQIANLRAADQRIAQLINEVAIARTARQAYAGVLAKELDIKIDEDATIQ